jgi:thiosulfate/3-mercaptopyruvate sulfurtransferase
VCHSQDYKHCNACHVGGAGITGSSYLKFKIGKNPLKSEAKPYDYVVVRHIPIAPTTFEEWGVNDLPNFDAEPTWKYATPHNIRRWTARTDTTGGGQCWAKCHNNWVPELDTYLRTEDMEFDYDVEPNKDVVIPN